MRYRTLLILAVVLGLAAPAEAGSVTLRWSAVQGATAYVIEQTIDAGKTWTQVGADQPPSVCTGTPSICTFTFQAPATGMVLFRYGARNALGTSMRFGEGTWHCQSCAPPSLVSNLEIQ